MSHQRPKKHRLQAAMVTTDRPPAVTTEPAGDDNGYLVIGLAAGAISIVGLLVIMIVLAAT
ncbi:MAG: hypothetical protein H0V37_14415 [Chloroflexia bacterium]|nr:hypothetical protein [Chloroflexia bacterium]